VWVSLLGDRYEQTSSLLHSTAPMLPQLLGILVLARTVVHEQWSSEWTNFTQEKKKI